MYGTPAYELSAIFATGMNPKREKKIRSVIRQSQPDLTVVLENIYDPLNISAVLRSCDAVGIRELFVVYSQDYLEKRRLVVGKRTSGGTFKWIDVYLFEDLEECMRRVKQRYGRVLAALPPADDTAELYTHDLAQSTALMFGNEDEGLSAEAQAFADGRFTIPQSGFAESLNISAACAVTLFEAKRQRAEKGFYDEHPKMSPEQQEQLFDRWSAMLKSRKNLQKAIPVSKDSGPLLPFYTRRKDEVPASKLRVSPLSKFDI
ncbi:MAG: RNA methyltransferase [Saprospiraceae bacterium]|nr:RNA methyltransferase [Saprospiraceae bacterium]